MEVKAILDALPWPVVVCGRSGEAQLVNRALLSLLGGQLHEDGLTELAAQLDQEGLFGRRVSQCPLQVALRRADGQLFSLQAKVTSAGAAAQQVAVVLLEAGSIRRSKAQAKPEPTAAQPGAAGRARVLVVDDEDMVRMVVVAVLVQNGYEVVEAKDGEEAIRKCEAGSFDLALVDLFMPRLNGLETLKELRQRQPRMQGVILSGVADVTEFSKGESEAIFLQKPFDNLELVQMVARILSGRI